MKSNLIRIRVDDETLGRIIAARRYLHPADNNPHNQGETIRKLIGDGLELLEQKQKIIERALNKLTPEEREALGR